SARSPHLRADRRRGGADHLHAGEQGVAGAVGQPGDRDTGERRARAHGEQLDRPVGLQAQSRGVVVAADDTALQ
ncbi:hypothetical protein COE41_29795, partial [Bacillus thuringiensis]